MNMHTSLHHYYKTNHELMYWHKYSLTELDAMYPWERKLYIDLLVAEVEKEKNNV
tara:strand:+ start:180 stop:344 length:165 start_codon:yes stop_codon:yes gene_type:complete